MNDNQNYEKGKTAARLGGGRADLENSSFIKIRRTGSCPVTYNENIRGDEHKFSQSLFSLITIVYTS